MAFNITHGRALSKDPSQVSNYTLLTGLLDDLHNLGAPHLHCIISAILRVSKILQIKYQVEFHSSWRELNISLCSKQGSLWTSSTNNTCLTSFQLFEPRSQVGRVSSDLVNSRVDHRMRLTGQSNHGDITILHERSYVCKCQHWVYDSTSAGATACQGKQLR